MARRVTQCVGSGICRWLGSSRTERICPNIFGTCFIIRISAWRAQWAFRPWSPQLWISLESVKLKLTCPCVITQRHHVNCMMTIFRNFFMSDATLPPQGYEEPGQLSGKAAQLLMKPLSLARLSRPGISLAIVSLASQIARWTRNHDLMLCRLLGCVKGSVDL